MKTTPIPQSPREHVNQALQRFLDDPNPGVLALKGSWGVGKTYVWNAFLEGYKKEAKQAGYAYVSLFGINSIAELRKFIFAKHVSLGSDKKKRFWQTTSKYGSNLIGSVDFAPATLGFLKNTELFSEWIQDKLLRDFVICIDDLERKEDSLTGSALLGLITSLREERKCKVVLIYNDAKVPVELNESFGEYREKVIDREITYSPSVVDNFLLGFPEGMDAYGATQGQASEIDTMFGNDKRTLLQLFECLNVTNIRVFQKTKIALDYFAEHLRSQYPKLYPHFVRQTVKICCLYYVYGDRWSLERLISISIWADHFGKGDNDSEKAKQRAARQPIRDIAYSPNSTDTIIAEYLKEGYVDWKSQASLLIDAEKQYEAGELNSEITKHWSKFWDNFTTSQDSFICDLQEFIQKNWRDLRLQEVDAADRFLRNLDPSVDLSDVLDKKIALFVEKQNDYDSLRPQLHDVSPDTIARVNQRIASSLIQIPIDVAIEQLTRNGGWNPSDVKYLANRTTEEFYDFFKSSERPHFLNAIKELRSRLGSSEDGKPVLNRVDDALRRLAKRSKLDEMRVGQTEVELTAENTEG